MAGSDPRSTRLGRPPKVPEGGQSGTRRYAPGWWSADEVRRRQTLERKAAFISQVTRGDLPDRDVDDIGDQALSFAEVKALATGDPLVLEKAAVDADVAKLTRLVRAHHDDQHRLRRTLDAAAHRADRADQRAATLAEAIGRLVDTRGDRFAMSVDGQTHTKRIDAGLHLQKLLGDRLEATPPETSGPSVKVGTLGGLDVHAQAITTIEDEVRMTIPAAHVELIYTAHELRAADPAMIVGRLERHLQRLPDTLAATTADSEAARSESTRADARIGQPWDRVEELARLRRRQQELNETLAASAEPTQPDAAPWAPVPARPPTPPNLAAPNPTGSAVDHGTTQREDVSRIQSRLDNLEARRPGPEMGLSR